MNTGTCSVSRDNTKATARTIQFDANNIIIILADVIRAGRRGRWLRKRIPALRRQPAPPGTR